MISWRSLLATLLVAVALPFSGASSAGAAIIPGCEIPVPSPEFRTQVGAPVRAQIFRLYTAFFLRQPDQEGYDYWVMTREEIGHAHVAALFADSKEFVLTYGSLTDAEYVEKVYANVMCRTPDPEGYAYWLGELQDRRIDRGSLMIYFGESLEYLLRTGTGFSMHDLGPSPVFANCTEVREAGRAPIYPGQPGFRDTFDRDGDGIGCEV